MKKPNLTKITVSILLIGLLASCTSSGNESTEQSNAAEAEEVVVMVEESPAVCIWDQVSVREVANSKGKWITSISVGESLTYLGQEAYDSLNKNRKYLKVRLADDTEGWSAADFIVSNGKIGVFLEGTFIYKRPDLLTKTEKKFERLDIVAVKNTQDGWNEVVGKRTEGTWIENGWIKTGKLSFESTDIAVAKFLTGAMAKDNEEDQKEALGIILDNPDLVSSDLIADVQAAFDSLLSPDDEEVTDSSENEVAADSLSSN